jgi:type I restriction enzyme M protein
MPSKQSTGTPLHHLWERCSASGLPPAAAFELLSSLVLLKQMEGRCQQGALAYPGQQGLLSPSALPGNARWSALRALQPETRLRVLDEEVLPWLRAQDFGGANHFRDAALALPGADALQDVMDLLDELFPSPEGAEQWEQAYDALMRSAEEAASAWAKRSGAFYTPSHLATLLADLLDPRPGESICDLACGNGRLLVSAYKHLLGAWSDRQVCRVSADGRVLPMPRLQDLSREQQEQLGRTSLAGFDIARASALQAWMHLRCLGMEQPSIHVADTLGEAFNRRLAERGGDLGGFDVIIANPPYHSSLDVQGLGASLRALGTTKAETLFVELALQCLRPGGRAALVVPEGVLFNTDQAHTGLRRRLVEEHTLHAIVSLPAKVFLPYTGVKTDILVFSRGGETREVLCYQADTDGYTLDARRRPQPEQNDLPDLLIHYWIHRLNPPGAWLRETQALATCTGPAFINGDVQLCWENVEPERISYHYAFPLIEQGETEGEAWFRGSIARPIEKPHSWVVDRTQLMDGNTLRVELYEPTPVPWGRPARAERRTSPPVSTNRPALAPHSAEASTSPPRQGKTLPSEGADKAPGVETVVQPHLLLDQVDLVPRQHPPDAARRPLSFTDGEEVPQWFDTSIRPRAEAADNTEMRCRPFC